MAHRSDVDDEIWLKTIIGSPNCEDTGIFGSPRSVGPEKTPFPTQYTKVHNSDVMSVTSGAAMVGKLVKTGENDSDS